MNGLNKKRCNVCKNLLPISSFYRSLRTKDGFSNSCKICCPVNQYAQKNGYSIKDIPKKTYLTSTKLKLIRIEIWNNYYKNGCSICDEKENCCLDFHHIIPSTKQYLVSNIWGALDPELLIKEIEKCVIVCKNCHTKIHNKKFDINLIPIILPEEVKNNLRHDLT